MSTIYTGPTATATLLRVINDQSRQLQAMRDELERLRAELDQDAHPITLRLAAQARIELGRVDVAAGEVSHETD